MGGFVAKQLRWKDSSHLDDTEENAAALEKLSLRLQEFCKMHADLLTVVFAGFEWETDLTADHFKDHADLFVVDDLRTRVQSKETGRDAKPFYVLRRVTEKTWMVTVSNLKYFLVHLRIAGPQATQEMQRVLERCRTGLRELTGVDSDLDTSLLDAADRIALLYGGTPHPVPFRRSVRPPLMVRPADLHPAGEPVAALLQEERLRFRLVVELGRMDLDMLLAAMTEGSKKSVGLRLTTTMVTRELQTLSRLAGPREDTACLKAAQIVPPVASHAHVRVTPSREVRGDLCYVGLETWDRGRLLVAASTTGYYPIRGYAGDTLDYTPLGATVYPTLVDLLKEHSPVFQARLEAAALGFDDEVDAAREPERVMPRSLSFLGAKSPSPVPVRAASPALRAASPAEALALPRSVSPSGAMSPTMARMRGMVRSMSTLSLLNQSEQRTASAPQMPGRQGSASALTTSSPPTGPSPTVAPTAQASFDDAASTISRRSSHSKETGAQGHASASGARHRAHTGAHTPVDTGSKRWASLQRESAATLQDSSTLAPEGERAASTSPGDQSRVRHLSPVALVAMVNRSRVHSFKLSGAPETPVRTRPSITTPTSETFPPLQPASGQFNFRDTLAKMQSRFEGRKSLSGRFVGAEAEKEQRAPAGRSSRVSSRRSSGRLSDAESSEEEEEDETVFEPPTPPSEMTAEHVQIHKLCKLLKGGDPTTTIVALSSLAAFDLTQRKFQLAVRDVGGLEPLVLLLGAEIPKIRIGAAELLKHVTKHPHMQILFNQLHGIAPLIQMLSSGDMRETSAAAAALTTLAMSTRNCRDIRRAGGIRKLLAVMEAHFVGGDSGLPGSTPASERSSRRSRSPSKSGRNPQDSPPARGSKARAALGSVPKVDTAAAAAASGGDGPLVMMSARISKDEIVANCAQALWSVSHKATSRLAIVSAKGVPTLLRLLTSHNPAILVPTVGVLREITLRDDVRKLLERSPLVSRVVEHLRSDSPALQTQCAWLLFNVCVEAPFRMAVTGTGTLARLVELSKSGDADLCAGAVGALWRCLRSNENVAELVKVDCVSHLCGLLNHRDDTVQTYAAGTIAAIASVPKGRDAVRSANGVSRLVQLLTATRPDLLANAAQALAAQALDKESAKIVVKSDGVRLLWSLLKSPEPAVQAAGALALTPCIDGPVNTELRSFVGGLPLVVQLLESSDEAVQANVCGTIANIARDEHNISIMSEYGVVRLLSNLVHTTSDAVRRNLALAIARCAPSGNNRQEFGDRGAVVPLVAMLKSRDPLVHQTVAMAMQQLSDDATNAATLREAGAVTLLMELMSSSDFELQQAAAGAIANIRRWHLLFSERGPEFASHVASLRKVEED